MQDEIKELKPYALMSSQERATWNHRAAQLMEKIGGKIKGIVFLIELTGLAGRKKIEKYNVKTIIAYPKCEMGRHPQKKKS